jgi:uncharacterized protein YecE (DUF72 family)
MPQKKWYIGCSGFYYKEWKEIFYPKGLPQKGWFEFYCTQFNTLEINNTFYRFPQLKNLEGWQKRSPEEFLFSVKVPGSITHYKQFRETETLMKDFYAIVRLGLGEKLGPVLFQLPPKFSYSEERLALILSHLNHSFTNVIEFRNESWWRKDVIQQLKENNAIFCGVSFPNLNDDVVINNPVAYYRFHGVPKLFYSDYDESFLQKVFTEIDKSRAVKTAFLYFNNTASAAALGNARFVQQLLANKV